MKATEHVHHQERRIVPPLNLLVEGWVNRALLEEIDRKGCQQEHGNRYNNSGHDEMIQRT
jgi:hypothetical protein